MKRRCFIRNGLVFLAGQPLLWIFAGPDNINIPYRKLGSTGLMVSELGFDCSAFHLEPVTENEIGNIIHTALELGFNYFEVSPASGAAAKKMGSSVIDVRNKMILAAGINASENNLTNIVEKSLLNLQTDYLDLVYLELSSQRLPNFPENEQKAIIKAAFDKLLLAKNQGLIRHLGVSGTEPGLIGELIDSVEVEAVKTPANLVVPHLVDLQNTIWPVIKSKNMGLVGAEIQGGKNQTGKYRIPRKYYDTAFGSALELKLPDLVSLSIISMEETVQAIQFYKQFKPSSYASGETARQIGKKLSGKKVWRELYLRERF